MGHFRGRSSYLVCSDKMHTLAIDSLVIDVFSKEAVIKRKYGPHDALGRVSFE